MPRPVAADRLGESYYHFSVAQMHARAGRMPEAIAEVRLAIQRDPKTAVLWTQLAQWLARTNQPTEAVAAAQKAVELEPENTAAYLTLAELYRRARRLPESEAALEKVIEHRAAVARRLPRPRAAALRAEGVRKGPRRAAPPHRRATRARPGAVSPRPHRHRDRELGRGAHATEASRRAGSRPGRRLAGPRLRLREPEEGGRGGRDVQSRHPGQPRQRGLRRASRRSPRAAGPLQGSAGRDRAARGGCPARPARLAQAGRHPV